MARSMCFGVFNLNTLMCGCHFQIESASVFRAKSVDCITGVGVYCRLALCMQRTSLPLLEKPPSHPSHTAAWESRHSMRFTQDTSPSKGPWASSFVSYVRSSLRNHALLSNIRPQTLLIFTQTNIAVSKHPLWIVTTSSMQLSSVVWCTGNIKKTALHIHNNEKGHMAEQGWRSGWKNKESEINRVSREKYFVCRVQEGMLRGFLFHVGAIPKQLKAVLGYQVCRRSQRYIWKKSLNA